MDISINGLRKATALDHNELFDALNELFEILHNEHEYLIDEIKGKFNQEGQKIAFSFLLSDPNKEDFSDLSDQIDILKKFEDLGSANDD